MTVHLRKTCGCGHEEAWHGSEKGPCKYGHDTATGGCTCDRFHRRSRAAALASAEVVEERDVPSGPFIDAIDEIVRTLVRLRTALAGGASAFVQPTTKVAARAPIKAVASHRSGRSTSRSNSEDLSQLEFAILTVLAQRAPKTTTRDQLAILAKYSSRSGSFAAGLASLRAKGFIEDGQPIRITAAGIGRVGVVAPLPSGKELLAHWVGSLSSVEGALLQAIADARPGILTREDLATVTRYSARSGSFAAALAKLRTLELIGRRELRLSAAFEDGCAS